MKKIKTEEKNSFVTTDDVIEKRNEEVEPVLSALEEFPGSTYDELLLITGTDECDFIRIMAWINAKELVLICGNGYFYPKDDD